MPETAGVKGLLKYIVNNPETRDTTSVSQLQQKVWTKTKKKPLLLCDYYAVINWILARADRLAIRQKRMSAYSLLFGGNYKSYSLVVKNFVKSLQRLGVQPMFFIDSPPGSSEDEMRATFYELKEQHLEKLEQNHVIQQVCDGKRDILQVPWRLREAISIEVEMQLRSMSVPLVYCTGDADISIVQYSQLHDEVCGVLSTDTVFATVPSIQFLHTDFFDPDNRLIVSAEDHMSDTIVGSSWPTLPHEGDLPDIVCEVTSAERLSRVLGIGVEQLADLSILCGNSYTRELNKFMSTWALLGLADLRVETVAEWLSHQTVPLPKNTVVKGLCAQVPAYQEAIARSCKVYVGVGATSLGPVAPVEVGSGLSVGCLVPPCAVMGFAHWRPVVVEANTLGHPCIGDLTLPLRKVWYALSGLKRVVEYGRMGNKTFAELVVVLGHICPGNVGPLHFIQAMSRKERVSCLFFLLTLGHHLLERGESLQAILSHSIIVGRTLKDPVFYQGVLVCACLLLTAELNSRGQPSPSIRISELEALIVTSLLCCAGVPPCHTTVLPCMRAITIASWFTSILEHAYRTAYLLGLCGDLPSPSRCFYSLAYIPFHIATVNRSRSGPPSDDVGPNLLEARRIFDQVINLPSTLTLRSFVLNKGQQFELQYILDIFAVAVREVFENSSILTPREGLNMTLPIEMEYKFDGEAVQLSSREGADVSDEQAADSPLTHDQDSPIESYCFETLNSIHDTEIVSEEEEEEEEEGGTFVYPEAPLEATRHKCSALGEKEQAEAPVVASPVVRKRRKHAGAKLPVVDHRENIMALVHKHRVICIQGETGCGKSTKIPQFILDGALSEMPPKACKILVSQPRRVAAMKLAERVAAERDETLGKTVGFAVAGEKRKGTDTSIVYCTTGYLLQMLIHDPFKIEEYTHIILDEIHERNIDADFAMLVVRKLVSDMPHVKVVLMSATMQVDLIVRYFQEVFGKEDVSMPYFVGAKLFPVETFFVDELVPLVERPKTFWHGSQAKAASVLKVMATVVLEANKQAMQLHCKPEVTSYMKNLCTEIIVSQAMLGESILVFLPGMADIVNYFESLTEELHDRKMSEHFSLFMLHSQIPLQEQRAALDVPPANKVHLILATNIAESSVTLPKLTLVINFGIYRQLEYNSKRHITCLSHRWCSHASCNQRAGRVGRVCPGTAIHLVTRQFYDAVFPEYDLAAMATAPLSKLVLQAKQIGSKLGVPSVTHLLSLAVEPPSLQQLEAALQDLASMGAIGCTPGVEISEEAPITLLGYVSLSLPVELPLARLVFLGVLFGCVCDAVVLAAALSLEQDVFSLPSRLVMEDKKYHASLARSWEWRGYYDGSLYSEPIAIYRMFREFLQFKANAVRKKQQQRARRCMYARVFSQNVAVRYDRLLQLESVVGDISNRMLGHLEKESEAHGELGRLASLVFFHRGRDAMPRFCDDPDLLKALMVASFCHQTVFGVTECNSCFKKERAQAVELLGTISALGLDYTRTLVFKNLHNVTQLDLDAAARHILPQYRCQTLVTKKTGFIQVSESTDENEKIKPLRSVAAGLRAEDLDESVAGAKCNDSGVLFSSVVVSRPIPTELRFLWQYGERHVSWKARPDTAELTRPTHPCTVVWYRMNVEKERVIPGSWRNMAGFVCELEPSETPFFAVPFMLQGTCNGPSMAAKGLTVLPSLKHSSRALRMLLFCQPLSTGVDLLVDRVGKVVVGARINSCLVMFEHHKLTQTDMLKINVLRMLISSVVSAVSSEEAVIPCDKATSVSMVARDLLSGTFDCCYALRELSVTMESSEPATVGAPDPAWEVASCKPNDRADLPAASVVGCPSLSAFELFPPLLCSLVKQTTVKEACSLLLQSVGLAANREPVSSFRLSPSAPPFTPVLAQSSAVQRAPLLHSVATATSPSASSNFPKVPILPLNCGEPLPAFHLPVGSSPISCPLIPHPPTSPHFHHSTPPRASPPRYHPPAPFPPAHQLLHSSTPASPLVPCSREPDVATLFQRALEIQSYLGQQQQSQPPSPSSSVVGNGLSPTASSPLLNAHMAAMRLLATFHQFAAGVRPPIPPSPSGSQASAVSPPLNPFREHETASSSSPPHPPSQQAQYGLFSDPPVGDSRLQQWPKPGQSLEVSLGGAAPPSSVPASPVWSGYRRPSPAVASVNSKLIGEDQSRCSSAPLSSPSPPCVSAGQQLEETRLVEFMMEYIASRDGCVNFNQLCRDAYPSYKRKYSIANDELALTWHFFVRHPKIFAVFGHPGYCMVQLLVRHTPTGSPVGLTSLVVPSLDEESKELREMTTPVTGVQLSQDEHTEVVQLTQDEHTEVVQLTQEKHTEVVQLTQDEHTEVVQLTQDEHTEVVQLTQDEHTEVVQLTQEEHTEVVQVTQDEHTEVVQLTQEEHTEVVQLTQEEHTEVVQLTQEEHTEVVQLTQEEHTEVVQLTQEEHTEVVQLTQEEHTEVVLLTQEEHTEVVQLTQEEHTEVVQLAQEEHTEVVQLTQEEHTEVVQLTQEEHTEVVQLTQEEHTEVVQLTQEEHTEVVQLTQDEHTEVVQLTQEERTEVIQLTQDEHTEVVQLTQEERTEVVQLTQEEHTEVVQLTQEEHTEVVLLTQDEHTEVVLLTQDELSFKTDCLFPNVDLVEHRLEEKAVEHGLEERAVEHGLEERAVEHGLEERAVEHGLEERAVEHGLEERAVEHGLEERAVEHGLEERAVEHGLEERAVEHGLEERAVEHGLEERAVEHGLEERAVEHGLEERAVEHGLEERAVEHGLEERAVEHGLEEIAVEHGLEERAVEHGLEERAVEHGLEERAVEHGLEERAVEHGLEERAVEHTQSESVLYVYQTSDTEIEEPITSIFQEGVATDTVGILPWASEEDNVTLDVNTGLEYCTADCDPFCTGPSSYVDTSISDLELLGESPDLIELQRLLHSISISSDYMSSVSSAQASSPGLSVGDDLGTSTLHTELENVADLCDPSLGLATWEEDGFSVGYPTWSNPFLSHPSSCSELPASTGMSFGEEWFDFSSFVVSPGESLPPDLPCFLLQETPLCMVGTAESGKSEMISDASESHTVTITGYDSSLERDPTGATRFEVLEAAVAEERGTPSEVDQLAAPGAQEWPALPVQAEIVDGSPGRCLRPSGVISEKTTNPTVAGAGELPRKPLVPYHLLDRQKRLQPGTVSHRVCYFVDYLMFLGGGAYFTQIAQVFRELYVPTFRLKANSSQQLRFFREWHDFVLYETPAGHFVRLRALSYPLEESISVEVRKCGLVAAVCRTLACEKKGLVLGRLKRKPDLMRRMKALQVDLLQFLKGCPDFFEVSSSSGNGGYIITLTPKAASVQEEFLTYYRHGPRGSDRGRQRKAQRVMSPVLVTSSYKAAPLPSGRDKELGTEGCEVRSAYPVCVDVPPPPPDNPEDGGEKPKGKGVLKGARRNDGKRSKGSSAGKKVQFQLFSGAQK